MGGRIYNRQRSQKSSSRGSGSLGGTKAATMIDKKPTKYKFFQHMMGKHQMVMFDAAKKHILEKLQIDLDNGHNIVINLRSGVNNGILLRKPIRVIAPNTEIEQKTDSHRITFENQISIKAHKCKAIQDRNW